MFCLLKDYSKVIAFSWAFKAFCAYSLTNIFDVHFTRKISYRHTKSFLSCKNQLFPIILLHSTLESSTQYSVPHYAQRITIFWNKNLIFKQLKKFSKIKFEHYKKINGHLKKFIQRNRSSFNKEKVIDNNYTEFK